MLNTEDLGLCGRLLPIACTYKTNANMIVNAVNNQWTEMYVCRSSCNMTLSYNLVLHCTILLTLIHFQRQCINLGLLWTTWTLRRVYDKHALHTFWFGSGISSIWLWLFCLHFQWSCHLSPKVSTQVISWPASKRP